MPAAPLLWCLLASVLFGASTPASKSLLDGLGPFTLAGLLYLGAALAVLPGALRARGGEAAAVPRWDRRNLKLLAGAVIFGGVVGTVLLLASLSQAPAASVALWLNLEIAATAVLAWAFYKEHLDLRTWLAAALVCVSATLLAAPSGFELGWTALLVGLACVAWRFTSRSGCWVLAPACLLRGSAKGL